MYIFHLEPRLFFQFPKRSLACLVNTWFSGFMVQLTADNSTFPATIVIGDMATVSVCMIMVQMMAIFRFYFSIALALQTFLSGEWIVKMFTALQQTNQLTNTRHFLCSGVDGFSLSSSPSSEDGQVTVCPSTTVTLTCTASQVEILTWIQEPDQQLRLFVLADYESEVTRVVERGPYTLTLVAVDNVSGTIADFTSTLEVMVDNIEDGTTISCDVFNNRDQLTVSKTSKAFECVTK